MPTVTGPGSARKNCSTASPVWDSWRSSISPVSVSSTATCCCRVCKSQPTSVMRATSCLRVWQRSRNPSLPTAGDRSHDISDKPPHLPGDLGWQPPRRAARRRGAADFLWFMSSDVFLTVPRLLARHCREVILLVIRDLVLPHDEDDLQPFRGQRPERLAMSVSPRLLLVVVGAGPDTRVQREERHVVDHVAQRLVAGETKLDDSLLLAAPLRHGHGAGVRLQMSKRLPASGGIPQA